MELSQFTTKMFVSLIKNAFLNFTERFKLEKDFENDIILSKTFLLFTFLRAATY
jgi:hypothetical protein